MPTIRRQPATWPSPDELVGELRSGQYQPGGATGSEVSSDAVNCLDLPDHRTPAQVVAHAGRAAARYPLPGSRVAPGRLIISTSGNVFAASIEGMGALP